MIWLYIVVGGGAGAAARYAITGWVQERAGLGFPWGTFTVNLLGSLLIGFALHYLEAVPLAPEVRALVTVGILGAFTTFSTFSYETLTLLESGALTRAALYSLGSLVLGVAAVYLGMGGAALLIRARG